jgi:O-antigen ligase
VERIVLVLAGGWFLFGLYCTSRRRTTDVIIGVAVVTVTWNDFRIPGGLTLSDPLLIAGAILAGLGRGHDPVATIRTHGSLKRLFQFGVTLVLGGLIGGAIGSPENLGLSTAIRFAISLGAVLLLATVLIVDRRRWYLVVRCYALGAVISALAALLTDTSAGFRGRATGLANHPNHFGLTMMLGMFCAMGLTTRSSRLDRYFGLLALIPLSAGLLASGSRAALASALLGLAFLLALQGARAVRLTVALAVPGVPLVLWVMSHTSAGTSALSRLVSPTKYEGEASQDRLGHYTEAWKIIRSNPITGVGFSRGLVFHDLPLQLLVTAGLLGLAAIGLLAAHLGRVIGAGAGRSADSRCRVMAGGIVATAAFLLVSPNLYDRFLLIFFAIAACAPAALTSAPQMPAMIGSSTSEVPLS